MRLVSTKLRKPHVMSHFIERLRLRALLDDGLTKKLTVVEAGAGSGKSLLLASYFSEKQALVWLNLNIECNDSTLFWGYILEGFRPFLQTSANLEREFLQPPFTTNQVRELRAFIINHLQKEPVYLVLDDFHLLENQDLLASIETFLEELPVTVHCVILSRRCPPFYMAKWLLEGQLSQITQTEMAFNQSEAFAFMDQWQPLEQAEKEHYWKFSEGWIGGLQLLLAANDGRGNPKADKRDKELIYDYLRREMFESLPADFQAFLLGTVSFSYFNPELVEALFPERPFVDWLEELESRHMMIQLLDYEEQAYRYHHLFEAFLKQEMVAEPVLNQRLKKGLVVFEILGDLEEALQIALELRDYETAMRLILQLSQPLKMLFYMNQVPNEAIVSNFDFTLQKLFFHYTNFELAEGLDVLQLAINDIPNHPEFELFRGMEQLVGELPVASDVPVFASETIQQMQVNETTKALMMIKNISLLFHQNRYQEGLDQVRANQELTKELNSDYLSFFNYNIEAQMLEEMGRFNESLVVYKSLTELLKQSDSLRQMSPIFELNYHISITGTYLKQLNLSKAKEHLVIIAEGQPPSLKPSTMHSDAYLYNLVVYWYLNEEPEKGWEGVTQLLQSELFGTLLPASELLRFALVANQLSQQFRDRFKAAYHQTDECLSQAQLLYIRLLIDEGRVREGENLLNAPLIKSRKEGIPLKIIEGNLLKIRAIIDVPERLKEAQDLYREAVYYACDDNALMPFFIERATLKQLFKRDYQRLQMTLSGVEADFHHKLVANWQLVVTILTERETEVLQEIAKGHSTKVIGQSLFISDATVKTHILNIYRKLEVKSRVAAVEKGQQVGILLISN